MRVSLGGPSGACSARRVRRLLAGELASGERDQAAQHLAGCARCRAVEAEVAQEKAELARLVSFESFAAGVAEKLAHAPAQHTRSRLAVRWLAPVAAAAAVVLVAGALLVRGPQREDSVRSKGGAFAQVFVASRGSGASGAAGAGGARSVHELRAGEAVPERARLQLVLHPAGHRYAAAVLLEPGEATVLYSGAAVSGALPQSFEWTGSRAATVLVVLADAPLDAASLRSRADAPAGAAVSELKLRR